jgi:hypothetical protein
MITCLLHVVRKGHLVERSPAMCRTQTSAYAPSARAGLRAQGAGGESMSDHGAGPSNSPASTESPQGTPPLEHLSVRATSQEDISGPFVAIDGGSNSRSMSPSPRPGQLSSLMSHRVNDAMPRPIGENHSDGHQLLETLPMHSAYGIEAMHGRGSLSCSAHCAPTQFVQNRSTSAAEPVAGCTVSSPGEARRAGGAGTRVEACADFQERPCKGEILEEVQPCMQRAAGAAISHSHCLDPLVGRTLQQERLEERRERTGRRQSVGGDAMLNPSRELLQQEFLRLEALVNQM